MNPFILAIMLYLVFTPATFAQSDYLGCFGFDCTPSHPDNLFNPSGAGSPYAPTSPNNPYGQYGSPYSPDGARNPYTTGGARLYNEDGEFRGTLNSNPYDPDSVANPYGRYGSPYSPESPNNPYTFERYDVFGE